MMNSVRAGSVCALFLFVGGPSQALAQCCCGAKLTVEKKAYTNTTSYIKIAWSTTGCSADSTANPYAVSVTINGVEYDAATYFNGGSDSCSGMKGVIIWGKTGKEVVIAPGDHDVTLTIKTTAGKLTSVKTKVTFSSTCVCEPDLGVSDDAFLATFLGLQVESSLCAWPAFYRGEA